ncbi:MAG: S9 family peptidase [Anaerolineae bacterium]
MATDRLPISPDDIYQLDWLEDAQLSPDGRWVAYVRVSADRLKNGYRRAIWVAATDGSTPPRQFTSGAASDSSPRWSPDGTRLAFQSTREGDKDQIFVLRFDGGEARALTKLPNGARSPAWSPDGRRIAFLARLNADEQGREDRGEEMQPPRDKWEAEARKLEERRKAEENVDPRSLTRLPYRSGVSFIDDRTSHIYIVDSNLDADDRTPRRLTSGKGNWSAPAWLPDGSALLATREHDPAKESLFLGRAVFRVPLDGSAPTELAGPPFTYAGLGVGGTQIGPSASPDGRWIAALRKPEERATSQNTRLCILPAGGSEPRDLTLALDRSIFGYQWTAEGSLLALVEDSGDTSVRRVTLDGVVDTVVGGTRIVDDFAASSNGGIAFIASQPDCPSDLWVRAPDGEESRLTEIHAKLLAERQVIIPQEIRYAAPDGLEIQGWVLYPPGFDPNGKYPLGVFIHGGPHTMWGPSFRTLWPDWQAAAGQGYVVFFCNPRGSEGYGQAFQIALHDGWGENDYRDILAGIEAVVARGGIDTERICVTGGSYGGFMTTWLIGHDQRFRAAVAQRGVYHLMSFYGTSDAYELIENEFSGEPWQEVDKLWRHSPLAHAPNIHTPLLILHADLDYRAPISDAEQLFGMLRRLGRTVEMVRYPREGHELTRSGEPSHRVDHLRRILDWWGQHAPAPAD